ncbi:hypothetical protein PIIN_11253 [Serendipita indica DSM 11827]|uniref:Uncharacterized protein n=1 Tax=Serendipita indica (strain DSM 11827) TaxID=1109443 RepID=G4U132_SERID|nr:hypothetical protein PIIN_11253 [Serendipita indica DSM 11827]
MSMIRSRLGALFAALVVFLAFPSGVVSSGWRIKSNLVFIGKGTFRSAVNFSKGFIRDRRALLVLMLSVSS